MKIGHRGGTASEPAAAVEQRATTPVRCRDAEAPGCVVLGASALFQGRP